MREIENFVDFVDMNKLATDIQWGTGDGSPLQGELTKYTSEPAWLNS